MKIGAKTLVRPVEKQLFRPLPEWPELLININLPDFGSEYLRIVKPLFPPKIYFSDNHPKRIEQGIESESNDEDPVYFNLCVWYGQLQMVYTFYRIATDAETSTGERINFDNTPEMFGLINCPPNMKERPNDLNYEDRKGEKWLLAVSEEINAAGLDLTAVKEFIEKIRLTGLIRNGDIEAAKKNLSKAISAYGGIAKCAPLSEQTLSVFTEKTIRSLTELSE